MWRILLLILSINLKHSSGKETSPLAIATTRDAKSSSTLHAHRQLPAAPVAIPAPDAPSTTNWWPFTQSQLLATSTDITTSTQSSSPLYIPFPAGFNSSTSTPQPLNTSIVSSTTVQLSSSFSSTPSTASSTLLPTSAIADPNSSNDKSFKFRTVYLVPAVAFLVVFIGCLIIWVVCRCLKRKPHHLEDDHEVGGPPYVGIEDEYEKDEEEGVFVNYGEQEEPRYSWPAFENPDNAFTGGEGQPFLVPPSMAPKLKSSRSIRIPKRFRRKDNVSSPHCSDTTSLALLEFYESDEEKGDQKVQREVPWESLRHKSIKRGILERVKEEQNWRNAIRGLPEPDKRRPIIHERSLPNQKETDNRPDRRRGHARVDALKNPRLNQQDAACGRSRRTAMRSDTLASDASQSTAKMSCDRSTSSNNVEDGQTIQKFRIMVESPPPAFVHPLRVRNGKQSTNRYMVSPARGCHKNPVKPLGGPPQRNHTRYSVRKKPSILPQSPSQITSPPLEGQLYFTPKPNSVAMIQNIKGGGLRSSPTKLVKIPPGCMLRSPHPPAIPNLAALRPDVHREGPKQPKTNLAGRNKELPLRPPLSNNVSAASGITTTSTESERERREEAMRKVAAIMERSWSTRELI